MVPADGQPVMSVSTSGGADIDAKAARTRESTREANRERESFSGDFYTNIGVFAETDHGNTPQVSNDAADVASGNVTYDIGYGHKITSSEFSSGEIHGIQFIDDSGNYIPLTQEQKEEIMQADFEMHEQAARDAGWDRKLEERDSSWDELDTPYQNALASLAYNVGGVKAGQQWSDVLDYAISGSTATNDEEERAAIVNFARELRRTDNRQNTAGMDNRVAKELYFAGLIDSLADVSSVLPFANAEQAGIPATAEYGSNPNRRPSGSQD
jgi:GH24 family phage-related lysozyme (muramidase)